MGRKQKHESNSTLDSYEKGNLHVHNSSLLYNDAKLKEIISRSTPAISQPRDREGTRTNDIDKPHVQAVIMDGGYSWVVLTCSFVIMFLTNLMWASYGVYILEFRGYYPEYSGLFAWMYAANIMVVGVTGIIAGPLVRIAGTRIVAICGAVMISSGYITGAYTGHVLGLFVSFAVILGTGNSFVNMATNVATQQYFNKKRGLANGILLTGSTLSIFVAPPVVTWLIQSYGWRGAFLLQGGACLNAIPAGILLIPFPCPKTVDKTVRDTLAVKKCRQCKQFAKSICACYLFRSVPFIFIMLGSLLYFFAQHTPIIFSVARAVQFGLTRHQGALVMSVWAVTCMCGQIVLGWLGDRVSRGPLLALALFCAGATLLLSIAFTSLPLQLAYGALYGLCLAGYNSMKIPTLVDILGVENLGAAQGINLLFGGVGGLLGPPISNMIANESGSYALSFGLSGIMILSSGLLMLVAVLYDRCRRRRLSHITVLSDTAYAPVTTVTTENKHRLQDVEPHIAASIHSLHMC